MLKVTDRLNALGYQHMYKLREYEDGTATFRTEYSEVFGAIKMALWIARYDITETVTSDEYIVTV